MRSTSWVGRFCGEGEVRSGNLFGGVEFCGEVS